MGTCLLGGKEENSSGLRLRAGRGQKRRSRPRLLGVQFRGSGLHLWSCSNTATSRMVTFHSQRYA